MARKDLLRGLILVALLCAVSGQFFVNLGDKKKEGSGEVDTRAAGGAGGSDVGAAGGAATDQATQLLEDWTAFIKWFRSNGGIISSKLTVKVRNGRQGVYFKERMRRGETIVSFPRNLRLDEKTAMKGKAGHIFQRLKNEDAFPDLIVILHLVHERSLGKDSFWNPYFKLLRTNYNNIMGLTEPQMKTLLRRPGCENTYNLGVMMRRTFNNFYEFYKKNVETWAPPEFLFSRDDLMWGFNTLVTCGWGQQGGNGDKLMVPFSDIPNHRRESAQKASNRGFISAAKEYQAGEELTFDYGLLNDAVLAYYGQPTPDCRGLKR
eukprot:CAMPEP_0114124890 /NCGR_PEP_ID=MMETSP0043_2-20121206/9017_1 /TAXON_ID=464988 /ORGANISM="Hemiselmis andersenii, Strain CCMP644" /LENGTH=319 /DNA_ID=CAMNT_0001217797 /DNA_START=31 /DNA_END=990 /DNA_ORIENTATION=-